MQCQFLFVRGTGIYSLIPLSTFEKHQPPRLVWISSFSFFFSFLVAFFPQSSGAEVRTGSALCRAAALGQAVPKLTVAGAFSTLQTRVNAALLGEPPASRCPPVLPLPPPAPPQRLLMSLCLPVV